MIYHKDLVVNAAIETPSILIRDIEGGASMHAVEELQKEVWGVPDLDVVPLTHLVAVKEAGGTLLGAFDGEALVGFAYGFVSYEDGRAAHHSHMLAVKPAYRNSKIGYQLKLAQRERVLAQGLDLMTWTFDPLQSLNAHFNFNKLGVISNRYLVDFYGADATSFLHRMGTDRLWVTWLLTSRRVAERLDGTGQASELPQMMPLVQVGPDESPCRSDLAEGLSGEHALIEVPAEINTLERQSVELAFAWRRATRWAFSEAIAAGYLVEDFSRRRRDDQALSVYLLTRAKKLTDFA